MKVLWRSRLCKNNVAGDRPITTFFPPSPQVYVAAFAVSAYASSFFRAGSKPFNPVLGETYECIREDKGFRFFSEQVAIHPSCLSCARFRPAALEELLMPPVTCVFEIFIFHLFC